MRGGAPLPHTGTHPALARALSARERGTPGRHTTPLGATHKPCPSLAQQHTHAEVLHAAAPPGHGRMRGRGMLQTVILREVILPWARALFEGQQPPRRREDLPAIRRLYEHAFAPREGHAVICTEGGKCA